MTVLAAILAFRDRPFEIAVVERMIFHLDGEPLVMRIERRAADHRPGFEDAVEFKTQIIMQQRRVMFLDDEAAPVRRPDSLLATWLLRLLKIALGLVGCEFVVRHRFLEAAADYPPTRNSEVTICSAEPPRGPSGQVRNPSASSGAVPRFSSTFSDAPSILPPNQRSRASRKGLLAAAEARAKSVIEE